jgi:hypothetical protein
VKCPGCAFEPTDALLTAPCPSCGKAWMDTADYVAALSRNLDVRTVLDIGCGLKGIIGQHHWEHDQPIKRGYACDRHILKPMAAPWEPLLMDAEDLPRELSDGVDFVTHCGMLEHVDYAKAFRVLRAVERVARKRVFFTCSAHLREVDYKVRRDGNPFHYYRSWWDPRTFELLGYHVDRERMRDGRTFCEEVVGWFDPDAIAEPWDARAARAQRHVTDRRCRVVGCVAEPVCWGAHSDAFYCLDHLGEMMHPEKAVDVARWSHRADIEDLFATCRPPWRKPLPVRSSR